MCCAEDGEAFKKLHSKMVRNMNGRWTKAYYQYLSHIDYYNAKLTRDRNRGQGTLLQHFQVPNEKIEEWPSMEALCGKPVAHSTFIKRFKQVCDHVSPFLDRAMQSLGGKTLAADCTFNIASRVNQRVPQGGTSKLVKAFYGVLNECSQCISWRWCLSESTLAREPASRELFQRWKLFGGLQEFVVNNRESYANQVRAEPQLTTDLCCTDARFWSNAGWKRRILLDLFHLKDRFLREIKTDTNTHSYFTCKKSKRRSINNNPSIYKRLIRL